MSLDGWKRASLGAVARRLGPSVRALLFCCGEGCPEARSVLQGPAVLLWRGRRL